MFKFDEKGNLLKSKDSTKNLLLKQGIVIDKTRRDGYAYMLVKDNKDLGYFTANEAHAKFIDKL